MRYAIPRPCIGVGGAPAGRYRLDRDRPAIVPAGRGGRLRASCCLSLATHASLPPRARRLRVGCCGQRVATPRTTAHRLLRSARPPGLTILQGRHEEPEPSSPAVPASREMEKSSGTLAFGPGVRSFFGHVQMGG